jgi:hypothetical protein
MLHDRTPPPPVLYTLCAIDARHFVDTFWHGADNVFTPFQIYPLVLADAHSCR